MRRGAWSDQEIAVLQRAYADTPTHELAERLGRPVYAIYNKAHALGMRKSEAYLASPAACRLRRGDNVGEANRFRPGETPWNKGRSFTAGGRSAETRFAPGSKPHNWRPVGSERLSKEGYLQRKMTDTGYTPRDWVAVHHLLWKEHHGPIPRGNAIVFRNSDKTDIRIENLELVTRQDLMRRNSVHNLPKPLAEVIQLRGALQRQINKRQRKRSDEKQDTRPA